MPVSGAALDAFSFTHEPLWSATAGLADDAKNSQFHRCFYPKKQTAIIGKIFKISYLTLNQSFNYFVMITKS